MTARQSEAVKTAGERLEAIEAWSRRTFAAAMAGVACLALMTSMIGYVGWDYLRLKQAAATAAESFSREFRAGFPAAPRPAGGIEGLDGRLAGKR